jgi:hypothetical protein
MAGVFYVAREAQHGEAERRAAASREADSESRAACLQSAFRTSLSSADFAIPGYTFRNISSGLVRAARAAGTYEASAVRSRVATAAIATSEASISIGIDFR